jgi:hypothetical protein
MDETRRRHLQEEMGEKMVNDSDDALLFRLQEYKQSFDKEMSTIIDELKRRKK